MTNLISKEYACYLQSHHAQSVNCERNMDGRQADNVCTYVQASINACCSTHACSSGKVIPRTKENIGILND